LRRRLGFWLAYAVVLLGVTLAGSEYVASFFAPTWPARDLRPIPIDALRKNVATVFADTPELAPLYNDWAVRDRPRSVTRPPDVRFRSAFVGDSFLEGYYVPLPLTALVEQAWKAGGRTDVEAINLGIAATSPIQYYYRIKDVALALKPDVIVVTVFAGNDFVTTSFDDFRLPALVEERPMPSALGAVAPRLTWLASYRLGLSEIGRGNKDIPDEFSLLNAWAEQPSQERFDAVVGHMKRYYFPTLGEATIREVLLRGEARLRTAAVKRSIDREFIAGWLLSGIIDWETGTWDVPRDAAEADRLSGGERVAETLSWLVAADRLAKAHGAQLVVALIPVGVVDPAYAEFWRPWPRYYSYSLSADARHKRLAQALRRNGVKVVDLREALDGVRGTYRLTDGHWNDRGTHIAAEQISKALLDGSALHGSADKAAKGE
jgi:hypothetical protein